MDVDMVSLAEMVRLCQLTSSYHNSCAGVGKSTLLRQISMREVPIPAHITILFVEQEVRYPET